MIIFRIHVAAYKNLMYYLSSPKIPDDLIKFYDREQTQGLLERSILVYLQLQETSHSSEAIYYAIPTMFKAKHSIWDGMCPNVRWPFLSMLTQGAEKTTKQSSNCSLVKAKGKENWNKNSLSVFIYKFQTSNKLSAAVIVYPLVPTLAGVAWGGGH